MYKHFKPSQAEKVKEKLQRPMSWAELASMHEELQAKYYGQADSREELVAYHQHWKSSQRRGN